MSCKKGCGNSASAVELIVKDLIRQMIDSGKLQEGLVDCTDKRLWRDSRVVTCDMVGDVICQMYEQGELCVREPVALAYDPTEDKLTIILSDDSTVSTVLGIKESHLADVSYNQRTKVATFKMSDNGEFTLNLGDLIGRGDLGRGLVMNGNKVDVSADGTKITFNEHGELTANTTPYVDVFGDPYINAF